jgi:hypothetical protein
MIRAHIDRTWDRNGFGLWIYTTDPRSGESQLAKPMALVFEKHQHGFAAPEPTLSIRREDAPDLLRALQDALSESEIQTSKQERREREMLAIKNHLSDATAVRDRLLGLVERGAFRGKIES